MEIKIASEDLTRALWIGSIVFAVIGFLLAVVGLIVALTVDDSARVQEAVFSGDAGRDRGGTGGHPVVSGEFRIKAARNRGVTVVWMSHQP